MAKKQITLDIPEKIKILGINASPRKSGNTAEMIKYTLKAAESTGYVETEIIHLVDYHLSYCTDCKKCIGYNKPADDPMMCYNDPEDQAHLIYAEEQKADGILLGYPVYKGVRPALVYMSHEKTYLPGSPFFNEPDAGRSRERAGRKPMATISQGGQQFAGQEQSYWGGGAAGARGLVVGAWPIADASEPQSSYLGGMLSCVDGMSVYAKNAWTSGASRVTPPTTGIRQERTLRNMGRWLAVSAMMMKLANMAFQEAEVNRGPEAQRFVRYSGGKPRPGSVIDKLIKDGLVTYVPQEELESRKKIRG